MAVTIKINPCPERYNSANPYKTGQTTSYATGDDGDLERGRGSDFTTLDFNNPFGNTNRFTDTAGGQTYSNDWVIDWACADYVGETVIGWYRVVQGGAGVNWATAMTNQPYNLGGYNDCYIPNKAEFFSILNAELPNQSDYAPLNFGGDLDLWTSTTNSGDNTLALRYNSRTSPNAVTGLGLVNSAKTNAENYVVIRYFTFAELGL